MTHDLGFVWGADRNLLTLPTTHERFAPIHATACRGDRRMEYVEGKTLTPIPWKIHPVA